MKCTKCGKELPEGTKFCPECGAALAVSPDVQALKEPEEPAEAERPMLGDQLMKMERSKFINLYATPAVLASMVFAIIAFALLDKAAITQIALAISLVSFVYVVAVSAYGLNAQFKINPEHAKKGFDFTVYMRVYGRWNIVIYIGIIIFIIFLGLMLPDCLVHFFADGTGFTRGAVAEFGPQVRGHIVYLAVTMAFLIAQMAILLTVTKRKALHYDRKWICAQLYGVEVPDSEQKLKIDQDVLNAEIEKMYAYCRYKRRKIEYRYEKSLYERGKEYANKPPFAVIWAIAHKQLTALAAAAVILTVVLSCVLPPVLSNPFRYGNVKRILLGDEINWTYAVLGQPDINPEAEGFGEGIWYSGNVKEYFKDPANFTLDIPEYQEIVIDYELKSVSIGAESVERLTVSSIRFDKKAVLLGENKAVKSIKLSSDTVNGNSSTQEINDGKLTYNGEAVYASIRYTDGSYACYYLPVGVYVERGDQSANLGKLKWADDWGEYTYNVKIA